LEMDFSSRKNKWLELLKGEWNGNIKKQD